MSREQKRKKERKKDIEAVMHTGRHDR